jgi:PDZ domain
MDVSCIRSGYLGLFLVFVFSFSAVAQDKPRVFMAGRGTINGMTRGSAGGNVTGGGWWAAGRTDSIVDSHDESMELAKDFATNCTGALVTVNPNAADYVTSLNRESKAKKGVFSKNNQLQVTNRAGDVLLSSAVRSVATAAKDACSLILSDFAAHGHPRPPASRVVPNLETPPPGYAAPNAALRTIEADRTLPVPASVITPSVPVPAETAVYAKPESEKSAGTSADNIVVVERKPTTMQPATPEPVHTSATLGDDQEAGSIGAWSDDKPGIRRDGVRISTVIPGWPADQVGIQQGDFILAIDDYYVFTPEELSNRLRLYRAGQRLRIRFRHNSTISDVDVVVVPVR